MHSLYRDMLELRGSAGGGLPPAAAGPAGQTASERYAQAARTVEAAKRTVEILTIGGGAAPGPGRVVAPIVGGVLHTLLDVIQTDLEKRAAQERAREARDAAFKKEMQESIRRENDSNRDRFGSRDFHRGYRDPPDYRGSDRATRYA